MICQNRVITLKIACKRLSRSAPKSFWMSPFGDKMQTSPACHCFRGFYPYYEVPSQSQLWPDFNRWWCRALLACASAIRAARSASWRSSGRHSSRPGSTAPFPEIPTFISTCCTPPAPSSGCTAGTSSWACSPHQQTGTTHTYSPPSHRCAPSFLFFPI